MPQSFGYNEAFSRNIGWVTEAEQQALRNKRIAIAGMGGVGGAHTLALTRLGIGAFHLSDMDAFGVENFNRQVGADMTSVDEQKLDVMTQRALNINPELDIKGFPEGINDDNLEAFLDGVDLYVDSLDFFAVDIRRKVFARCYEKGIPAVTAAPLGMGVAFLSFLPGKMSFEDYFQMEGKPEQEQLLSFLVGLSPSMLQLGYLVDESRVDFHARKGPSTGMACELCAGVAATNALKILLNRGDVIAAPWGLHFDAFRNKMKKTWRLGGNSNPLQKLVLGIARKKVSS